MHFPDLLNGVRTKVHVSFFFWNVLYYFLRMEVKRPSEGIKKRVMNKRVQTVQIWERRRSCLYFKKKKLYEWKGEGKDRFFFDPVIPTEKKAIKIHGGRKK